VRGAPLRQCECCGQTLDYYRRQARYCGGPCRAAASRARAARRAETPERDPWAVGRQETAPTRTHTTTAGLKWSVATGAEEALAERLKRDYPEMWAAA
jgi:hypothetical protein